MSTEFLSGLRRFCGIHPRYCSFSELAEVAARSPKSLMRILGRSGNPQARNPSGEGKCSLQAALGGHSMIKESQRPRAGVPAPHKHRHTGRVPCVHCKGWDSLARGPPQIPDPLQNTKPRAASGPGH